MRSNSQDQAPIGSKKKGQAKRKGVDKEEGKKAQVAEDKGKEENKDDDQESMVMSCIEGVIAKKLYKFQAVLHELQLDVEMAVESKTSVGQQQELKAQGVEEGPQQEMEAEGAKEGSDKDMEEEVVDQGIDAVEDAQAQAHAVYMASLAMHQEGEDQF
ncbi:hypothetical protein V8C86DRAFT_3149923 [Haematococcus lacustris]